jgi:hypothetical protein
MKVPKAQNETVAEIRRSDFCFEQAACGNQPAVTAFAP